VSTRYPTAVSNLPGQMTEKLRFHRKKHSADGFPVTPSTDSASTENAPVNVEPGQVGEAENGVVGHHEDEEEEEQPKMNIVTTIVIVFYSRLALSVSFKAGRHGS